jgi:hypothetical protein
VSDARIEAVAFNGEIPDATEVSEMAREIVLWRSADKDGRDELRDMNARQREEIAMLRALVHAK